MTLLTGLLAVLLAAGCTTGGRNINTAADQHLLRLGYMPNLTHAQAVLGVADGSLERTAGVQIEPRLFYSGTTAVMALFAGEVDLIYVGPSPAVNGYIRSEGQALRVVAGAASGGAILVVRPGIDPAHLDGRTLATPGLANTQDVAMRAYLDQQGIRTRELGGKTRVTPLPPPEILGLFERGRLDGAWVAEPWGSRLIHQTGAVLALDERELWPDGRFATTLVAVSTDYLSRHPDEVKRFLKGHAALTRWIEENRAEAVVRLQADLAQLQGQTLPDSVLTEAFRRIDFVTDPMVGSVHEQAQRAHRLGLLGPGEPDLSGLFELGLLGPGEPDLSGLFELGLLGPGEPDLGGLFELELWQEVER